MKKRNFLSLVVGVTTMMLTATTIAVQAQPSHPQAQEKIQELISKLNLTQEQQAQFQEIRSETKSQLENILSGEQKEAFQTAIAQGQTPLEALAAINLSSDQKTQMQTIRQSSQQQISNILTEEQRQQLRQEIRSRQGRFR